MVVSALCLYLIRFHVPTREPSTLLLLKKMILGDADGKIASRGKREFCHRVNCLFKICEGKKQKQKNSQSSHVAAECFVAVAGRVCVCVFSRVVGWRGGGVPLLLRQQPQLCNIIWRGVNKKKHPATCDTMAFFSFNLLLWILQINSAGLMSSCNKKQAKKPLNYILLRIQMRAADITAS